ncbi:hypothetical protein MKW94_014201 [Papaver nudicaule]|uniref:Chlororespiratory reduction 21 n=1 Tax=Papaver nudicaule TaxID=74823 RepID=A0AA41SQ70_PAPNU|nr:hypothetical protein [Papaver nudicaule]
MASSSPLPLHTTPNLNPSHSKPTKIKQTQSFKPTQKLHEENKSYFHQISALCKQSQIKQAITLLTEMNLKDVQIGPEIYGEILQGCVYERALSTGQQIHARILKNGGFYSTNEYIETKLVIFYAKCDLLDVANQLFGKLEKKNVFSWAAIIGLCCRMGSHEKALMGFNEMHKDGFFPDNFVIPNALKACSALQMIGFGKGVHGYALKMGYDSCVFVSSSLVDMYGKCGLLEDAKNVFDEIVDRNVVTWNSMIVSYVQNGMNEEALKVFYCMRMVGVEPTRVTVASFLSAAANVEAVDEGRQGHAIAVISGLEVDNILGSSLINFYSKIGSIEDAELVFSNMFDKDVVTWNLLISGYVQQGKIEDALDSFRLMRSENFEFDSVTLATILSASAKVRDMELGKECHSYCVRNNLDSDVVIANSIIEMYGKCESTDKARRVFEKTIQRDLTLWNTLIAAYAESGLSGEALKLFYQMQLEGVPPNVVSWNSVISGFLRNGQVTEAETLFSEMQCLEIQPNLITWTSLISGLAQNGHGDRAIRYFQEMQNRGLQPNTVSIISLLSACINISSLEFGKAIHGYIIRSQLFSSLSIVTSLVDMYAKCGNLRLARKFYDMVNYKELPIYNAMISGYSLHGQAGEALEVFNQMQNENIKPDEITFTGLLSACNHAGLVEKGLKVFSDMISEYRMKPSIHHYGCMVSLLSRCGYLDEALRFVLEMPLEPDAQILGTILSACKEQNNIELGEYLSQHLFKLEPDNPGNYVALSNTYAAAGRWDEVSKLRNKMKEKKLRKTPGCSWTQIGTELHAFVAGDKSHSQTKVIYETLAWLEKEMRFTHQHNMYD